MAASRVDFFLNRTINTENEGRQAASTVSQFFEINSTGNRTHTTAAAHGTTQQWSTNIFIKIQPLPENCFTQRKFLLLICLLFLAVQNKIDVNAFILFHQVYFSALPTEKSLTSIQGTAEARVTVNVHETLVSF